MTREEFEKYVDSLGNGKASRGRDGEFETDKGELQADRADGKEETMSDEKVKVVYRIEATEPGTCDLCGEIAELRPYGPNGENICFQCGMKDEESTRRAFEKVLDGVDAVEVSSRVLEAYKKGDA